MAFDEVPFLGGQRAWLVQDLLRDQAHPHIMEDRRQSQSHEILARILQPHPDLDRDDGRVDQVRDDEAASLGGDGFNQQPVALCERIDEPVHDFGDAVQRERVARVDSPKNGGQFHLCLGVALIRLQTQLGLPLQGEMELTPVLGAVHSGHSFSLDGVTKVVDGFVNSLAQGDRLLVKAISAERGGLIITNLVNTTIIAIKIGMGLKYPRQDLMRLGLAAILHDVGMCLVPEEILNKPGPLTTEERNLIKRHPELGAQALRQVCPDADWIADLVLQEHERLGGQGYPRGLQGAEIHEYAQIIGLADTFEALLHVRPYRQRFLPHEAVRELVTKEKTVFSTKTLKCLIQQFSVFPLGTRVRLNTGESAEVVELNPQYPLRPVVKVQDRKS